MVKKLLFGGAALAMALAFYGILVLLGYSIPGPFPESAQENAAPLTEETAEATNSLPPQHPVERPAVIDVAKMAEELGINSARITKALVGVPLFENKEMWFFIQLQNAQTLPQVMDLYLRGNPPTEQLRKQALRKLLALSKTKYEISLVRRFAQTDRDAEMEDEAIRALAEKFYKEK